jgi:hypothetical protein
MKKTFAFILLLAFSAQTFSQGMTLVNFYFHRSYIAKNQCENRFRPMLHCNGKCVLAKKMKEQERKEQQQPELKLSTKYQVISSRSFFAAQLTYADAPPAVYRVFNECSTIDRTSAIFHPPCW